MIGRILALPGNAQGAVWILVGSLFLSANEAVVKTLGTDFHPIQMALFRYAIGMVLLMPWFVKAGRETWRTRRLGTHFARATIAGVGQAAVYYGVIHLFLADATAVAFSRPLFLTLLAVRSSPARSTSRGAEASGVPRYGPAGLLGMRGIFLAPHPTLTLSSREAAYRRAVRGQNL